MFNYDNAFSRNIGWFTPAEQALISTKKIAIAGLGGVGGEHLTTLARLGFQHFHIADFDAFEEHNFNRQAGAFIDTLNHPKASVMAQVATNINPQVQLNIFTEGVTSENVDAFLCDVDVYVDSLDFFAMEAREMIFRACTEKSIPIVTAAPLGMGCALLTFLPGKMDFDEYFGFSSSTEKSDKLLKFLVGLAPSLLQTKYLMMPEKADFQAEKGPSLAVAIKLCAGMAQSTVLKIVLERGDIVCAPRGFHVDAYLNKAVTTYCPFGYKGWLQRLKLKIARKVVLK